jgi:hypothetical protein
MISPGCASESDVPTLVPTLLSDDDECGRLTPKFAYTLMTKPEQSAPFVRLVPP